MVEIEITCVRKDWEGNITHVGSKYLSIPPIPIEKVIREIEDGFSTYYVYNPFAKKVFVHVVNRYGKKYLRTGPDDSALNNLDHLPIC